MHQMEVVLTTHQSCGSLDQVQNYMDYSNDTCMDTFTANQLTRMVAVMENSPRRVVISKLLLVVKHQHHM